MNSLLKNRIIFAKIKEQLNNDLVLILTGARQVGKTFILKLLIKYLEKDYPQHKILYFDLEKPDILDNFADYNSILNYFKARGIKKDKINFVLLDEFQKMPTPTKTLKILHDNYPMLKIVATGSSSLDIYKKLRAESMTGRKRIFYIYPLEFAEFLDFTETNDCYKIFSRLMKQDINPQAASAEFISLFENFAIWGGYPRASLIDETKEKQQILSEIYQSYLNKDVVGLLAMEDTAHFNKLVSLLAAQISGLFNINEISKMLNVSRYTIEKYLFILKNTFVIKFLTPFYTNKQKEVIKMPKLYFIDTGLRNFAIHNFNAMELRQDSGQLIENAVYLELTKNISPADELHFWRTPHGTEVDFIVRKNQNIIPIEVKYKAFQNPTVPSNVKAFIREYKPKQAFVLTRDYYKKTKFENCIVYFLPTFLTVKIINMIR